MSSEYFSVTPIITKEQNPATSISRIEFSGFGRYMVNSGSSTTYFCTKGAPFFFLRLPDGNIRGVHKVQGESIRIPANTPYIDFSQEDTQLLAITKPAYDVTDIKMLHITLEISDRLKSILSIWNERYS